MNLLFLTCLFPLIGFVALAFSGGSFGERKSAILGVGSIGLSFLTVIYAGLQFLQQGDANAFLQPLWQWIDTDTFKIALAFRLDGLSLTMLGVVTGVGFLIHLFAAWYMHEEEGFSRFFAYTNLFVASMLVLVLADNLMFVYLGWEGVGLCSYLLIGFYYKDPKNVAAAMKAFIVTRIGDVFFAIGLFVLYHALGTLNIQELLTLAPQKLQAGDPNLELACLMLLGGAVGKSAQLPLQTWLADAMAGPTPVSALIHAATMVTAGVYLIARTNGLFLMAPDVLHLVGIIGAITLIGSGFAALVQTDIKRILAYSTMSQIGYMFLALGVGCWDGAIFHLMTHAFFKALLFLSSGSVILACHHEQNIFKMGGLRRTMPLTYLCFLVGGSALAALPFVTAGFFSKDEILYAAYQGGYSGLLTCGLIGAFLTSIYTFRLIFVVFHGEEKAKAHTPHGLHHHLPLVVLMILSTFVGALITPPLQHVFPEHAAGEAGKGLIEGISGTIAVVGILLAALLFLGKRTFVSAVAKSAIGRFFSCIWFHAWGFDWLYQNVFIRLFLGCATILKRDPVDQLLSLLALVSAGLNRLCALMVTGNIRWYAASMSLGAVVILTLLLVY